MRAQVVQDDDVAWLQSWHEHLFKESQEDLAVGGRFVAPTPTGAIG
jgi:hypothetical protein